MAIVGRQQMGLDILGFNIDLGKALESGGTALQTSLLGQVGQNPAVQQAGIATAQKTVADSLSVWLIKNQKSILIGVGVVAAFGLYKLIRR